MNGGTGPVLVIGYGNTLRGDDGVGPVVAEAVAAQHWPNVRVLTVAQLTPELAELLASARAAVFIDARLGSSSPPVTVIPLGAADVVPLPTHSADPRCLLALARALFGKAPPAWLVTVAGRDFSLRESLTTEGRSLAREAQACVEGLIRHVDLPTVTA